MEVIYRKQMRTVFYKKQEEVTMSWALESLSDN